MAPSVSDKYSNTKVAWMRSLHKSLAKDVAELQSQLRKLERKKRYLQGEALYHQAQLSLQDSSACTLGPIDEKLFLHQEHIDLMQKRITAQKLVSSSSFSMVKVEQERVVGMDEGLELESHGNQDQHDSEDQVTEKGLVKLWTVEGNVGDFAYSAKFSANYDMEILGGKITEVKDLRLSTMSDVIKKVMNPARALLPATIHQFTSDLYFYQMLYEEREETADHLESDIPNLEIERGLEPMVLKFLPTREYEVKVLWSIIWDSRNNRLKYDIAVECTDEAAVRYSSSEEVYPYLSGHQQLKTWQEVADFIEAFLDL